MREIKKCAHLRKRQASGEKCTKKKGLDEYLIERRREADDETKVTELESWPGRLCAAESVL